MAEKENRSAMRKIISTINSMSKKKEELWLSRIIPYERGKKEQWIISLVNKRKEEVTERELLRALRSVNAVDQGAEYWVCERMKKGKWLCTFHPKGGRKSWRF